LLNNKYRFRHTKDIIDAAEGGLLPDKIMINMHPQRWDDWDEWSKDNAGMLG